MQAALSKIRKAARTLLTLDDKVPLLASGCDVRNLLYQSALPKGFSRTLGLGLARWAASGMRICRAGP